MSALTNTIGELGATLGPLYYGPQALYEHYTTKPLNTQSELDSLDAQQIYNQRANYGNTRYGNPNSNVSSQQSYAPRPPSSKQLARFNAAIAATQAGHGKTLTFKAYKPQSTSSYQDPPPKGPPQVIPTYHPQDDHPGFTWSTQQPTNMSGFGISPAKLEAANALMDLSSPKRFKRKLEQLQLPEVQPRTKQLKSGSNAQQNAGPYVNNKKFYKRMSRYTPIQHQSQTKIRMAKYSMLNKSKANLLTRPQVYHIQYLLANKRKQQRPLRHAAKNYSPHNYVKPMMRHIKGTPYKRNSYAQSASSFTGHMYNIA